MNLSLINISGLKANEVIKIKVAYIDKELFFNFRNLEIDNPVLESLTLKNYNLSIYDNNDFNRILYLGLPLTTTKELNGDYSSIRLKGNLEYTDSTNISISFNIDIIIYKSSKEQEFHIKSDYAINRSIETDEDVINLLLEEINVLKHRVKDLESSK